MKQPRSNFADLDHRVVAIKLARNFDHQIALSAGLQHFTGERVPIIDADPQDPPELLPEMIKIMDEFGADVVYGQGRKRDGETPYTILTAGTF